MIIYLYCRPSWICCSILFYFIFDLILFYLTYIWIFLSATCVFTSVLRLLCESVCDVNVVAATGMNKVGLSLSAGGGMFSGHVLQLMIAGPGQSVPCCEAAKEGRIQRSNTLIN